MDINTLSITDGPRLVRRGPKTGSTLYSAYRPLRFSELYGPAKLAGEGLKRSILSNNRQLAHPAISFTGFSGTGKTASEKRGLVQKEICPAGAIFNSNGYCR